MQIPGAPGCIPPPTPGSTQRGGQAQRVDVVGGSRIEGRGDYWPVDGGEPHRCVLAALLAANQGLDYMSATGQTHSAIADTADDSIVWWPDGGGGAAMRATFIVGQGFDATATATVTDASGNVRVRGAGQTRLQVVTTVVGSTNLDAPSAAFFVQSAINVYCTRKPSLTRWV